MKNLMLIAIMIAAVTVSGCGKKTPEQKVEEAIGKTHALTPDERSMASINAKQFFEKEWPVAMKKEDGTMELTKIRGALFNVRPSDSNYNGLVSATGMAPTPGGGFKEIKVFCGYRPELVGCSDEDTVAK